MWLILFFSIVVSSLRCRWAPGLNGSPWCHPHIDNPPECHAYKHLYEHSTCWLDLNDQVGGLIQCTPINSQEDLDDWNSYYAPLQYKDYCLFHGKLYDERIRQRLDL